MKTFIYIMSVLLILINGISALNAMPPHPDVVEKFRGEGRYSELFKKISSMQLKKKMSPGKASSISSGTVKIPVLLVQYSSASFNGASSAEFYSDLLNGSSATDISVRKYYSDMSNGMLKMQFDVYGPYTASDSSAHYGENDAGGNDKYPGQLVNEAVNEFITDKDSSVNFSIYDNDNNGTVDTVIVIHCGAGEETPAGVANDIWSHQWDLASANRIGDGDGAVEADDVLFNVYTIQPEYTAAAGDSTVGVFCHELGHVLGLQDLYDTTGATNGVGNWSIMGNGSWGDDNKGTRPAPFLAWERYKIGGSDWITLSRINKEMLIWKSDKWNNLILLMLIAVMFVAPVFITRISPVFRGAAVSGCCTIMAIFLSCGSESSSDTRINGTINDIEESHHAFRITLNDPDNAQYLYIEGKKASDFTAEWYVPGTGILITHIHEGVVSAYSGTGTINDGASRVHGVNIIEASEENEPGKLWTNGSYYGTSADLFCLENNDTLADSTSPDARYYTGTGVTTKKGKSGVIIKDISSNTSFPMTFSAELD